MGVQEQNNNGTHRTTVTGRIEIQVSGGGDGARGINGKTKLHDVVYRV